MVDFVSERVKNGKNDKEIVEDLLDSNLAPDTSSIFNYFHISNLIFSWNGLR